MMNRLLLLLLLLPLQLCAQEKTVVNSKMIGVGATRLLDTYLSPEHYSGTEVRFIDHTIRQKPLRHWSTEIVHQGYISQSKPRSKDATEVGGMYSLGWGRHYNWNFLDGALDVRAGGMGELNLGFLYNTRNSNNPAQARVGISVSPSAAATWHFRLWNRPFHLGYELSAPLLGLMFSPNYGQSYYEIFTRGNYDHNAVVTTPFSAPSMRHLLTLDFTLWKTTFRVGYMGDYQQSEVNEIKYHNYSHLLVVGFVKKFSVGKLKIEN